MWWVILYMIGHSLASGTTAPPADPCSNNNAHQSIPQVCVSPNTTSVVTVLLTSLSRHGQRLTGQYPVYITNDREHTDWSTLVVDPPGQDWRTWSTTESSIRHRKVLRAVKSSGSLILTIDLTKGNITDNGGVGCWGFLVWEWRTGKNQAGGLNICQRSDPTTNRLHSTPPPPSLSQAATERGIRARTVDGSNTLDDSFLTATGMSGQTNNWLLLAEQAGNMSGGNCIVCMGSRPLLQIVPAPLPVDCVAPVMNFTLPRSNCTGWDKTFPVTKAEKSKPLFSSKVASRNFTCVNLTKQGLKLGKFPENWSDSH